MKNTKNDVLYIVIPCYNEQEVIKTTFNRIKKKLQNLINENKISNKSKILFVNDGSNDKTWDILNKLCNLENTVMAIKLSRNRGHQNALLCGLTVAKNYADMVISMDADLQDDINVIDEMINKFKLGCDIVYGVRSNREKDTFFKRFTAELFYKIMNFMGAESVYNHADFRLMSKRALNELCKFKEVNLFLRGIIPILGFKSDTVKYVRNERFAGKSKYTLKKMLSFAVDGITSFSIKPIRFISGLGFLIIAISIIFLIYTLIKFFIGFNITSLSWIITSIWLVCGLLLLSLGVVGEYVGKTYIEVKNRPRFIIEEILNEGNNN